MGHRWSMFKDHMWKRDFQIEGGIILLLGALIKWKFDGLKSRRHRFSDFWNPWGPFICGFEYTRLHGRLVGHLHFCWKTGNLELLKHKQIPINQTCFWKAMEYVWIFLNARGSETIGFSQLTKKTEVYDSRILINL